MSQWIIILISRLLKNSLNRSLSRSSPSIGKGQPERNLKDRVTVTALRVTGSLVRVTKLRVIHDPSLNVFLGMKIQVQVRVHGLGSGFRVQGSGFRLEMQVTGIFRVTQNLNLTLCQPEWIKLEKPGLPQGYPGILKIQSLGL